MAIKYKWLAQKLEETLYQNASDGILKLPTEAELCAQYRVSRQTVREALHLLTQKGILEKKQGSGSYFTGLSKENNCIAIILPEENNFLYPALQKELTTRFTEKGYRVDFYCTRGQVSLEREILISLLSQNHRGIVAEGTKSGLPNPNLDLYNRLAMTKKIVFLRNPYPEAFTIPYVVRDHGQGVRLLIHQLLSRESAPIAGIFCSEEQEGLERYRHFMLSMQEEGYPVKDEHILFYTLEELADMQNNQTFSSHFQKKIQEFSNSCNAILCQTEEIAYFVNCLYRDKVPQMTLATFESTYLRGSISNPLLSLSCQNHSLGQAAFQLMDRLLKYQSASSMVCPFPEN